MTKNHTVGYQTGDLSKLVDFIYRIRKPEELPQFPTGVDFEEMFVSQEVRESTPLWLDEKSRIIGYAMLDPRFCNLFFEVDPQQDVMVMQAEMIEWGISRFRQLKKEGKIGEVTPLDTNCDDKNESRISLLKSLGFIPQDLMTLHLSRSLSEPIPPIVLPAGFIIRPVAGESEVAALVELYHAAYRSETMTQEDVLAIMRTSSYVRELDLVAVAPDGRLAGLCSCGIETDLNAILPWKLGSTDPVLVHPEFQNQGLARALIWTGWEKLKACGMHVVELSTSSQNEKGIAAFTKTGYRIDGRRQWFSHPAA